MTLAPIYWGGDGSAAPLVCGLSAVNGLGFNAHQTWALWRASVDSLKESPFRANNGERATMCHQATLPPKSFGADRMVPLLTQALDELAPAVARLPQGVKTVSALCLSERYGTTAMRDRRAERDRLSATFSAWLNARGLSAGVRLVPQGHASLALALQAVGGALMSREVDAAIVGGVDTYYDPDVVKELIEQERFYDNEDIHRVIGGEGAAVLLIARRDVARAAQLPALAEIQAVVTNEEPSSMFSNVPNLGLGLSRTLRSVTEPLRKRRQKLDWMLGDVTHEDYRMQEFMFAFPRLCATEGLDTGGVGAWPLLQPLFDFDFIPERFGDLGAASMPTGVVLAAEAFSRGDPQAYTCILFGASVTTERGAILLVRPSG